MNLTKIYFILFLVFIEATSCFGGTTSDSKRYNVVPPIRSKNREIIEKNIRSFLKPNMEIVAYSLSPDDRYAVVFLADKNSFGKGYASKGNLHYVEDVIIVGLSQQKSREAEFVIDKEIRGGGTRFLFSQVWSPDGKFLLLPTGDMGPFVLINTEYLNAWIGGSSIDFERISAKQYKPHNKHPAKVHRFISWHSSNSFEFSAGCCGTNFVYSYDMRKKEVVLESQRDANVSDE